MTTPEPQSLANWEERAACRVLPIDRIDEVFFPAATGHPADWREARAWCNSCPVQPECAAYAFDNAFTDGMYGGLTPEERRALRRKSRQGTTPPRLTPEEHMIRMDMWHAGHTDPHIADQLGVHRTTITGWRRAHGLAANRTRRDAS